MKNYSTRSMSRLQSDIALRELIRQRPLIEQFKWWRQLWQIRNLKTTEW